MSFNSYCRDCGIHFADKICRNRHTEIVHFGLQPQDPEITENSFYYMNAHVPQVRAKTCPVCLLYFESIDDCIIHVNKVHPNNQMRSLFKPTRELVINEWEHLVESVFPGSFYYGESLYFKVFY